MIEVNTASDLAAHTGQPIGRSNSVIIDQQMIDLYAKLTGDDHWIHVDVERAARDMPDGKTIAHGLLVLSLATKLKDTLFRVKSRGAGLNYGYDRVRFIRPVQVDTPVQLELALLSVSDHPRGTRIEASHDMLCETTGQIVISAVNILLIQGASS